MVRRGGNHPLRSVMLGLNKGGDAAIGGKNLGDFALYCAAGLQTAVLARRTNTQQSSSSKRLKIGPIDPAENCQQRPWPTGQGRRAERYMTMNGKISYRWRIEPRIAGCLRF